MYLSFSVIAMVYYTVSVSMSRLWRLMDSLLSAEDGKIRLRDVDIHWVGVFLLVIPPFEPDNPYHREVLRYDKRKETLRDFLAKVRRRYNEIMAKLGDAAVSIGAFELDFDELRFWIYIILAELPNVVERELGEVINGGSGRGKDE